MPKCKHEHTRTTEYHRTYITGGEQYEEDRKEVMCLQCGEIVKDEQKQPEPAYPF